MSILYGDYMKEFEKQIHEFEKKRNEELAKTGIFYAFSNQQFEENKTHKEAQDNEYLTIGGGAYIHKSNKEKLDNYFNKILPKLKKEFLKKINLEDLIEYELINHECYYTGDWFEVVPIIENYLDSDISQRNEIAETIEKVYKMNYKKNMEAFE